MNCLKSLSLFFTFPQITERNHYKLPNLLNKFARFKKKLYLCGLDDISHYSFIPRKDEYTTKQYTKTKKNNHQRFQHTTSALVTYNVSRPNKKQYN